MVTVCLSVCLSVLVATVSPAKMAELNLYQLGLFLGWAQETMGPDTPSQEEAFLGTYMCWPIIKYGD